MAGTAMSLSSILFVACMTKQHHIEYTYTHIEHTFTHHTIQIWLCKQKRPDWPKCALSRSRELHFLYCWYDYICIYIYYYYDHHHSPFTWVIDGRKKVCWHSRKLVVALVQLIESFCVCGSLVFFCKTDWAHFHIQIFFQRKCSSIVVVVAIAAVCRLNLLKFWALLLFFVLLLSCSARAFFFAFAVQTFFLLF